MKLKIKKFLKDYGLGIIIGIILCITLSIKIPYYIEGPGGLIPLSERFEIDGEKTNSYNLAYVSSYDATILMAGLSLLSKDYDLYHETKEAGNNSEVNYRNRLLLEEANDEAIIYAYQKAGLDINIKKEEVYITYVYDDALTDLKVGDELLTIDGIKVTSKKQIKDLIESKNAGETIKLTVLNNNKIIDRTATLKDEEGRTVIGVLPTVKREISYEPKIEFKFEKSESGSSGGFMTSLAIYDLLTGEDLAKNLKIAGTGTIDLDGNVGQIGGIKYKIMGALDEDLDIFFVPKENYAEAKETVLKKKGNLNLVSITTFDEALNYLKTYKKPQK